MNALDFGTVYERYAGDVLRFALYLTGDRTEAEGVCSETFARAWTAREEIRSETTRGSGD